MAPGGRLTGPLGAATVPAMALRDDRLRDLLDPLETGWRPRPGLRDAAVLVPWFTREGRDHVLYTLRRDDLPVHPGEISFPGGAREADEDALACALRETHEEIGLAPEAFEVLGALSDRVSIAGFLVRPFVARLRPPFTCRPDPGEVERVLSVAVDDLLDETRWVWRTLGSPSLRRRIPFFELEDGVELWGMTALLTRDLLERLRGGTAPAGRE